MTIGNGLRGASRKERIPAHPLAFWLNQRLNRYIRENQYTPTDQTPHAAVKELARDLDISDRALYRYLRSLNAYGKPTDTFIRARVEDMLHEAGVGFYEVYPDLAEDVDLEPDAWCRQCGEMVTPISSSCPWCSVRVDPGVDLLDLDQAA